MYTYHTHLYIYILSVQNIIIRVVDSNVKIIILYNNDN